MNDLIVTWTQQNGWKILVILALWLASSYAATRFGQRLVSLILTKERAVLQRQHRKLSVHDQQRIVTLSTVISQLIRSAIMLIFGSMLLTQIGIPVIPVFAGAGIVGITLGFGAQSIIKDVLAGLFVVLENQYAKGDQVVLGQVAGVVEDLSLRVTVLRDAAGVVHYIPNGTVTVVSNHSKQHQPQEV